MTAFAGKDPGLPRRPGFSQQTESAIQFHAALGQAGFAHPGVAPELWEGHSGGWLLSAGMLPFDAVPIRQTSLY